MRPPSDYRAIHQAADRIGPELARAILRGLLSPRKDISINRLANALAARDIKAAMAILAPAGEKAALSAAATVVKDAVMRGGRIGAGLIP